MTLVSSETEYKEHIQQPKFIPHQDFNEETTSRGKGRKMKARNQDGFQCRADWTWEIMKYASP